MADIKNSSLNTGIQAYWDLQEASGTRYDLVGSKNLTDNATVTSTTGKVGTAAFFTCANSEFLDTTDSAALDIDDGWSVSYWFKIDSTQVGGAGDYQYVYSKRSGENGVEDFVQNDSGTWYLYVGSGSGTFSATKINTALSLNTWYHIVTYYNGASSKCYINGSSNSISLNAITTNAANLYIGGKSGAGTANFAGAMDEFGIWNRELTQTDVDSLYNSGSGIAYYVPIDIKDDTTLSTSLVSYWKLDETSGTRNDSHGTNHLTDVNTVSYQTGKLGNAADFEKDSSQSLQIAEGSQTGLDITSDLSISAWVKWESQTNYQVNLICGKQDSATDFAYYFMNWDTEAPAGTRALALWLKNSGGSSKIFYKTYSFATATWYHVTATYKASTGTVTFYVDGSSLGTHVDATYTAIKDVTTGGFAIGARYNDEGYTTDGLIDELAIYSKELTIAEVRALYGYGTPPEYDVVTESQNFSPSGGVAYSGGVQMY